MLAARYNSGVSTKAVGSTPGHTDSTGSTPGHATSQDRKEVGYRYEFGMPQ